MISNQTKTVTIIASVFLVVTLGVYSTITYLVHTKGTSLQVSMQDAANTKAKLQELTALKKLADESANERAELASFVLGAEGSQVIGFLKLVETIGDEQGVELVTKSLTEVPGIAPFEELKVEITIKGQYAAVIHTLKVLENVPYQSHIPRFRLSKGEGEDLGYWSASFDLYVTKYESI